jgi:glyoxylase-like metal-dependent hydrolase (beta-lactamase superfamily II)
MIKIKRFVFNSFEENTYLLYDETQECIIIDAGCSDINEEKEINNFIEKNKLVPRRLLNTHGHIDHILGNNFFGKQYSLFTELHQADEFLVSNIRTYAMTFGISFNEIPRIKSFLDENSVIKFGNSELTCLFVPGHTPDSLAFYNKKQNFVFTGDVLFNGSIGRTDLPGGSYDAIINSIKTKLLVLDGQTVVYSGHGEQTTIEHEKNTNPFLTN